VLEQESVLVEPKFGIGDFVRISVRKGMFEHGFEQNFTDEIFIVTHIIQSNNINWFRIKERSDKKIT
jgi:hypothetical protein